MAADRLRRTLGSASCVRERARFVAAELRNSPSLRRYRLRGSGLMALVRHPLLDMWVLEEVFRFRVYEPPAQAARLLGGLGRPPRIVDLGGHAGYFALFMLGRHPAASVVSFEPDPRNARVLESCIKANGRASSWQLVEACAATADGELDFASSFHLSRVGPPGGALAGMQDSIATALPFLRGTALLAPEVTRVAARDVFPVLADADLVKIDVEGAEWQLLEDARFRTLEAAAIALEYHPPYAPHEDPDGAVRQVLHEAGYETGRPLRGDGGALVWGWRRSS